MKQILTIVFLFIISASVFGQSNEDKAKAFYFEAEKQFDAKKYSDCLESLDKIESLLGSTNTKVLNLKTKAYFENGDYEKAKRELNKFSKHSADMGKSLPKEILEYIIVIDEKLAEQRSQEATAQKQKADAERKRLNEQREYNAWQQALADNTIDTYSQFMVDYNGGKYYYTAIEKIALIQQDEEKRKVEKLVDIAMQANAIAELEALRNKYPSQKEKINNHLREIKCYEICSKHFSNETPSFPTNRGGNVYYVQDDYKKIFEEFKPIFSAYGEPIEGAWNSEKTFESEINNIIKYRYELDERDIIKMHYVKVEGPDLNPKNKIDFLDIGKNKKYTMTQYKFDIKNGRVLIGENISETCFDISQSSAGSVINYHADNQELTVKITSNQNNVFDVDLSLQLTYGWIDINVSNGKAYLTYYGVGKSGKISPYKPFDISTEKSLVFRFRITNADRDYINFWITGDGENPLNPTFEQEGMLQEFSFPRNDKEKSFKVLYVKSTSKSVKHYIDSIEYTIFDY